MARPARTYASVHKAIRENQKALVDGIVVAIDPSIGSTSSMPGYAVYRQAELVDSGTLEIDPTGTRHARLQRLVYLLRALYSRFNPDILVYEELAPRRYGGGNAESHASLLKSLGAILSVSGPDESIGLPPPMWKRLVHSDYIKGDEEDAKAMGYVAIELARAAAPLRVKKSSKIKGRSTRRGKK